MALEKTHDTSPLTYTKRDAEVTKEWSSGLHIANCLGRFSKKWDKFLLTYNHKASDSVVTDCVKYLPSVAAMISAGLEKADAGGVSLTSLASEVKQTKYAGV